MRFDRRGQGATEYLLMLAAVLVIVAIAVYYVTSTGPSAIIIGTATLKSGDATEVIFTPSNTMVPTSIPAAEWEWAIYRGGTEIKAMTLGTTFGILNRGIPVSLTGITGGPTSSAASGDILKIKYKGSTFDAATVA